MDAFLALADPTRRRIIESLADGECAFGDLAVQFDMSRPAVSKAQIVPCRSRSSQPPGSWRSFV